MPSTRQIAPCPRMKAATASLMLAGEAADGRRVIARQRLVDARQHRVPVDQQVEHDDRRDQQQRHEVDQRQPAAPHRGHDGAGHRRPVLRQLGQRPVERRLERGKARAQPVAAEALHEGLEALRLAPAAPSPAAAPGRRASAPAGPAPSASSTATTPTIRIAAQARFRPRACRRSAMRVEEIGDDDGGDEGQQDVPAAGRWRGRGRRAPPARTTAAFSTRMTLVPPLGDAAADDPISDPGRPCLDPRPWPRSDSWSWAERHFCFPCRPCRPQNHRCS